MWLRPATVSHRQAAYLSALGRAIALAQNFESNCKFVFGVTDFGEAFSAAKFDTDDWQEYGRKLMRRSLGATLIGREKNAIFKKQIPVLEAARLARNFFAHQAAEPALYVPPMRGRHTLLEALSKSVDRRKIAAERNDMVIGELENSMPFFENAARDLAQGDAVVSAWSYRIQEKAVDLPRLADGYVDEIVHWVLEPIRPQACSCNA